MKVIRSAFPGFCMGVRQAVEIALRESAEAGGQVYTLGPLIHNPVVLEEMKKRGIGILEENELVPMELVPPLPQNSCVIIRAHGVSPLVEEKLVRLGAHVLDATCPHVKESQKKARSFAEKGYGIFLAGEEKHAEIAGIRGYIEAGSGASFCFVVGSPAEAEAAAELCRGKGDAGTALLGQTTISPEEYRAIGEVITRYFPGLEIVNTICGAAAKRQAALRELCGRVDAVIIAGGRESANTRRLLSLALELGKPAWLVERPEELPREIGAYGTVGLSAGASTPDSLIAVIEEVLGAL